MSPTLLLLLSLASCSLLQGKPVLKLSPQLGGGGREGPAGEALVAGQEGAQRHLSDLLKVTEEEKPKWSSRCDEKENPRVSRSCVRVLALLFCQLCLFWQKRGEVVLSV